ncbi:hypothetical protein ACH5RR_035295 [Cinchona calisaya]|uniref:tRNA pseudouridine(55) synthase n=1 Tax=Cinchona calisaya TaxID=153742 RepID=A0ABD2YDF3_9GENT
MATEILQENDDHDKPQISFTATTNVEAEEDLKLVEDAFRTLRADAVKDLNSVGACVRCIFRLFGLFEKICSFPSLPTSAMYAMLAKLMGLDGDDKCDQPSFVLQPKVCRICFGILEFVYHDGEKGTSVKRDCVNEFAETIAEVVKNERHQVDSFSLEVSLPPVVMENEQLVRLYMKKKYGSEDWFLAKSVSECISVKDALKLSIADPLEKLLVIQGEKSNLSTFRIRLAYETSEESTRRIAIERINGCKRRKTDVNNGVDKIRAPETSGLHNSADHKNDEYENIKTFAKELEGHDSDYLKFQLEKDNQPFHLVFLCYRCPIYIGGRYLKYSRNVSQTRWIIEDERMGEASVEEIIGGSILPLCQGNSYKFHAAGREDIDVRMLGTGRPFLVEIQNARQVLSEELIKEMEIKINSLENKLVGVKNLKILDSKGWALMREGEGEKQKQYAALVWISRPFNDDDLQTLSSLKEMQIMQKTPIRVLHRRSPLERERIIHWMKVEMITGSCQYFLLHLCTQAGTYIKEFVHGDLGRTQPSIGSILGCRTEILQLDVTDVKMDCF